MFSSRIWSQSLSFSVHRKPPFTALSKTNVLRFSSSPSRAMSFQQKENVSAHNDSSSAFFKDSPLSGMENDLVGYVFGKKKATEVAHLWVLPFGTLRVGKHVVPKGYTVVDATCSNGYDTLAMLKMVADESGAGRVSGLDIQRDALESTSLLDESVNPAEVCGIQLGLRSRR